MRGIIVKAGEISKTIAGMAISILLWALVAVAQQNAPASAAPAAAPPKGTPVAASTAKSSAKRKAAPKKSSAAQPSGTAKAATPTPEAEKSGKERDPFRTLIPEKKASDSAVPVRLPPGKKGLVIEQLQLQGIARGLDGGWIAVVDNKTKRAYFLHDNDEVYNGKVTKVLPDRIIYEEINTDAMGKKTSREIVRMLSGESGQ